MKDGKYEILVIVGTVREGRAGRNVAEWYIQKATQSAHGREMDFRLLDLADLNLPLFAEAVPPAYGEYSVQQQELAKVVRAADGFVFVTAEYNHSIPGSLKNFLDHLYAEWKHRPAAFVGYGVSGAQRAIEHLIQVLQFLKVAPVGDHIGISKVWEAFDENATLKEGYADGDLDAQLEEFGWWVRALHSAEKFAPALL